MVVYYRKSVLVFSFCLCLILMFVGCTRNEKSKEAQLKLPILKQYTELHTFSNPIIPDTFKLTVIGASFMQSKTVFEIISSEGNIVYADTINTSLLVTDVINVGSESDPPTADDETKLIERILKFFFHPENFSQPAIGINEVFDKESNTVYWQEIKADTKAVSFVYPSGKEGLTSIAYLKRLKKAVVYSIIVFHPPVKENPSRMK